MGSKEQRRSFALAFCITLLLAILAAGCTTACLRTERMLSGGGQTVIPASAALPQEETEKLLEAVGRYGTYLPAAVRFGELAAAGVRTGAAWAAELVSAG